MPRIKVTAYIEPDEEERDDDDACGLTNDAFDHFMEGLMALGLDDISIYRESTEE